MNNNLLFILTLLASFFFMKEAHVDDIQEYPIAVIGSGAAGTMATERAVLNNRKTLLLTGAKKAMKSGRGHWVRKVENIPSLTNYTRTINQLREETLQNLSQGPFQDKLHVVANTVASIEKSGDSFIITDIDGAHYKAKYVILATGIMEEQPHINDSIKPILRYANKQLVAYCILCDGHRSLNKTTAIIGHSENAANTALVLYSRYQSPTLSLLTNGAPLEMSDETLQKLAEANITIYEEPIIGIDGDSDNYILNGFQLDQDQFVPAEIAFVSLGIRPNNQLAVALGANIDSQGLVETDEHGETSVENLFVIGDLRANSMKQIYTAWQHAVDAVQQVDRKIRNQKIPKQ